MAQEPNFLRKIQACAVFLEELVTTENYTLAALVSNAGNILDKSFVGGSDLDLHELAKNVGTVLSSNSGKEEGLKEIILEFPQWKVYFEKLGAGEVLDLLWLMVCMDSRVLYYKQNLRRTIKRLNLLLYRQG